MNAGIILAGGTGSRFGTAVPKQYQIINGREVISYPIQALKDCPLIDAVIAVASDDQKNRLSKTYGVKVVPNGNTRNESLYNGLNYVNSNYDCDKVIILEAARPMVTADIVSDYIEKLKEYDAVITGQKIVDSLGCYKKASVNRDDYYLIQAPEAFDFKMLFANFNKDSRLSATNQQMPPESGLYINFGFPENYKITYFRDLKYCESLMSGRGYV